jgi:hypothetical protein
MFMLTIQELEAKHQSGEELYFDRSDYAEEKKGLQIVGKFM